MHFSCNKKDLADAVPVLQRAVSPKSSLPALEGILIKASQDCIELFAYDLELGMYTKVPASVDEPGDIVLNAKMFTDIVRRLPSDRLEIKTDEKLVTTITSGASEFTIIGIPAGEFPDLPSLTDGELVKLPENMLSSMIRQTIFAISTDETKAIHTGTLFEINDGAIRLVSVDGFRLAIRNEKLKFEGSLRFVVPGKTLSEVYKILDSESDKETTLSVGKKFILFEVGGYSVISRLLEGEFLDYKSVLGGKSTTEVRVNVRGFGDSIDRASLLISERMKSPVRCTFEPDRIKIKCATTVGRIYDEVPAKLTGDTFEMGFNNRYLTDALRAAECDEVKLGLNGPLSPMKIYPISSDSFVFLVLPLRLKSENE
jgi:DNA polymerase-3 subunit beta